MYESALELRLVCIVGGLIAVLLLASVRLLADDAGKLKERKRAIEATQENARQAATLMKDWAAWLVAIQTAVTFGALTAYSGGSLPPLLAAAVLFLTASILFESLLLAGLPTLVLRLQSETGPANDLYEAPLFVFMPVRTGAVYLLTHLCFATGVAFIVTQLALHGLPEYAR